MVRGLRALQINILRRHFCCLFLNFRQQVCDVQVSKEAMASVLVDCLASKATVFVHTKNSDLVIESGTQMSYNAVACERNCLHCNTDSDFSSGRRMNQKYCSIAQNSTPVTFSLRLFSRYVHISRHQGNYWMQKCEDIVTGGTQDISYYPARSDIGGENMVLKTLQMFEADHDLAPYCFW